MKCVVVRKIVSNAACVRAKFQFVWNLGQRRVRCDEMHESSRTPILADRTGQSEQQLISQRDSASDGMDRHTEAAVRDRAALESESSGETFVAIVKTADFWNRDHLAAVRRMDGTSIRAIFVEREMCLRAVIVIDVRRQAAAKKAFVDHEYVIQTPRRIEPMTRST
jgi:hypothetical protein